MATWEFTSEHCSSYDVEVLITKLNERSADGWEVVTIIPTGGDVTAFFRREKPSDDAAETDKPTTEKTEGAFAAGGLDSLKVGIASAAQEAKDKKDDDKEADKAPSTLGGAVSDENEKVSTLVGDAPSTASTSSTASTTPDAVKEPSGWAVSPDVPASSTPSTPAASTPSVATPAASTPTVTTPSVSTPSSSSPSPWSNSSSSTSTTPSVSSPSSPSSSAASEPMAPIGGSVSTPAPGAPSSSAPGASTPAPSAPSPAPAPSAPTPAPAPVVTTPAGWYPDPSGRFEMRYWDGQQWTEYVSRAGQQYTDPPVA